MKVKIPYISETFATLSESVHQDVHIALINCVRFSTYIDIRGAHGIQNQFNNDHVARHRTMFMRVEI